MPVFLPTKSIYYDDVNLIAQPQNTLQSRKHIPRQLDHINVAPMSAVVGKKFAIEAIRNGLNVCLPRFGPVESQINILKSIYDEFGKEEVQDGWRSVFVAVGLNDLDRVNKLKELGHKQVLIDVASGYLKTVVDYSFELAKYFELMVGNIHSAKGINLYAGHNRIRVRTNIGSGSACKTSDVTGYTRGQITEITECYRDRYHEGQLIVADGGVKCGSCAAKAFGAGSDEIMMGGYFALAEEAQNVIDGEYKYWGGASHLQQIKQHGEIRRHSEGKELDLDKMKIKPLKVLVDELWGGIASAISYSGYQNLTQFIGNGVFEIKK